MVSIPAECLASTGTAEFPFSPCDEVVKESVLHAIELGYRHFDTAALYQSEQSLGEAIAEALRLCLAKSRDELFITSKLWVANAHRELVLLALQNCLENLGSEYLDLYLIHFPARLRPGSGFPFNKEHILVLDYDCLEGHGGVSKAWPYQIYWSQQFLMQETRKITCNCKNSSCCQSSGD